MDVDCSGLSPAQRAGLKVAVPKGVCAMSEPIHVDPAGRAGAYYVLGLGEAEACVALGVAEEEFLEISGGRAKYLADRRVKLSAEGDGGAARRRIAFELADQLGVPRKDVEAELDREEGA